MEGRCKVRGRGGERREGERRGGEKGRREGEGRPPMLETR